MPFIGPFIENLEHNITNWISGQILFLTNWLTGLLITSPAWFVTTSGFQQVHSVMMTLAWSSMILIIAWIGISLLTAKITPQEAASALGRGILSPVLTWSAPQFLLLLATIFDRLSAEVLGAGASGPQSDITSVVGAQVGLMVFLGVYAYTIIRLVLFYAYRNYALLALVAMSPLVFLLWILPGHQDKAERWSREVVLMLSTQLAHSIQLLLLSTLTMNAGSPDTTLSGKASFLLLQIGAMQFMLRTPDWLREYIHPMPREAIEGPVRRRIARARQQYTDPVEVAKKLWRRVRGGR